MFDYNAPDLSLPVFTAATIRHESHRSKHPKIRRKSAENRLPFHASPTGGTSNNASIYFERARI